MIKGITGGYGVSVTGGNTVVPYVPMNNENPIQGMMRVWGSDMQVFNGSGWTLLPSSYSTVTLDGNATDLLEWARKKKAEEQEIEILATDHPAVRIAKENLNKVKAEIFKAEQQLKATIILSKDEQTTS